MQRGARPMEGAEVPTGEDQFPYGLPVTGRDHRIMTSAVTERMILDSAMPTFDAAIAKHVLVGADPATTFAGARDLDLLTVHTPLLDAAMWIRTLPERWLGRATPSPPRVTVAGGGLRGWVVLGERSGREIAFGAVGKVWRPVIEWRDVEPSQFLDFAEPGWAKIAAHLVVIPYGERSSLVRYECRTATTDSASRRRFLRYWRLVRPFVGPIMQAMLDTIKDNAEAALADRNT